MKFILLALLFATTVLAVDPTCFKDFGNNRYDMSWLIKSDYYTLSETTPTGKFNYFFDICHSISVPPCGIHSFASGLQQKDGATTCMKIADAGAGDWSLIDNNPAKGVQVEFGGGDTCSGGIPRITMYNFTCDPTKTIDNPGLPIWVGEVSHCIYGITWPTYYGCPNAPTPTGTPVPTHPPVPPAPHTPTPTPLHPPGVSGGTTFLIIVIVGFALYCGGGMVYKGSQGATGSDMMPNADFWRGLPGLVKDGCGFCAGGGSSASAAPSSSSASAQGYQTV